LPLNAKLALTVWLPQNGGTRKGWALADVGGGKGRTERTLMARVRKTREPTPSDREVLTGLVERVTYQNAENGFCVLRIKARGQRELVTLVGKRRRDLGRRVDYGGRQLC
jgi:hypothetical protein